MERRLVVRLLFVWGIALHLLALPVDAVTKASFANKV